MWFFLVLVLGVVAFAWASKETSETDFDSTQDLETDNHEVTTLSSENKTNTL